MSDYCSICGTRHDTSACPAPKTPSTNGLGISMLTVGAELWPEYIELTLPDGRKRRYRQVGGTP